MLLFFGVIASGSAVVLALEVAAFYRDAIPTSYDPDLATGSALVLAVSSFGVACLKVSDLWF